MGLTNTETIEAIRAAGILPVLRAESEAQALALADALAAGGVQALEVTMTVPGALGVLRRLGRERPKLLLGMGTVLDAETARMAILEGAQFIISPAFDRATVELCRRYGIAVMPGALTPTEILHANAAGADAIKLFPASAMGGAAYLRALRAPLPHLKVIPTGGVSLATAEDFLAAGALALGIGADLVDTAAIEAGNAAVVAAKAGEYLRIVRAFQARSSRVHSDGKA